MLLYFNLPSLILLQGAQLYIPVIDLDSFSADLIVRIRFDLSFSVGLTTTFISRSSNFGPSLTVSATLLCAPFYSGSSCEILDQCESDAVTCSERERCVNGFNGPTCICIPPYISVNCESQNFCINRNCNERGT